LTAIFEAASISTASNLNESIYIKNRVYIKKNKKTVSSKKMKEISSEFTRLCLFDFPNNAACK
jgi:hypothetical protein